MNNELNFSPNFERLFLGCIDADFHDEIIVFLHVQVPQDLRDTIYIDLQIVFGLNIL